MQRKAAEQLCFEHPHCKAPARPSCVIPVAELGSEGGGGDGRGRRRQQRDRRQAERR